MNIKVYETSNMKNYTEYTVEDFVMDSSFRSWAKKTNKKEETFWDDWLGKHPERKKVADEAAAIILTFQSEKAQLPKSEVDIEIAEVRKVIDKQPRHVSISPWNRWMKIAAVFIGLLFVTSLVYYVLKLTQITEEVAAKYGEIKTVTLPDGSEVILSGNSSLKFSKNWGKRDEEDNKREVFLSGMAYFKVKHIDYEGDASNPVKFVVHAQNVDVEVVGTEFNVSNREEHVKVVLNSGKIKLSFKDQSIKEGSLDMNPGDRMELSKQDHSLQIDKVDSEKFIRWKNSVLKFENTSLEEVGRIIEEAYGITVIFKSDSLKNRALTGSINNNDIEFVLKTISLILNIQVHKERNTVIFEN